MEAKAKKLLLVALDFPAVEPALAMVDKLPGFGFKVGKELYEVGGPEVVREIVARGGQVFRDGKWHDIPNTVKGAAAAAARNGCSMCNIHFSDRAMTEAALEGVSVVGESERPKVLVVTVLTSISDAILRDEVGIDRTVQEEVLRRAKLAQEWGADGVVASPLETALIREACGPNFLIVTPGIRQADGKMDDQKRAATPTAAIENGASRLVIGRPITAAPDPVAAAEAFVSEIAQALRREVSAHMCGND